MVDGPNMYNFCGGDPVNRSDPMGTDYLSMEEAPSEDDDSDDLDKPFALFYNVTTEAGKNGTLLRKVRIGTVWRQWERNPLSPISGDEFYRTTLIKNKYGGGKIKPSGYGWRGDGQNKYDELNEHVKTKATNGTGHPVIAKSDAAIKKVVSKFMMEYQLERLARQRNVEDYRVNSIKIEQNQRLATSIEEIQNPISKGIARSAFRVENMIVLGALESNDKNLSANDVGLMTWEDYKSSLRWNFLKGGAGVALALAPGAKGFVRGSFQLAPRTPVLLENIAANGANKVLSLQDELAALQSGRSAGVNVVGSESELNALFRRLSEGGKDVTPQTYPGRMVELPDGTRIGLRLNSKSGGPTIDIHSAGGEALGKVHIE